MKNIKFLILLSVLLFFNSCSKEDESLNVDFSITHDTYSNIQSPFTVIEIKSGGEILDRKINVGRDESTWNTNVVVPASGSKAKVEIWSSREGGKTVSVTVSNGDSVTWNTINNAATVTSSSSSNGLVGTWIRVDGCSNSSGTKDSFTFSSGGTGNLFQVDCNGACSTGGVRTNFNYAISGGSVSITPTSVPLSCGVSVNVPAPFTLSWSISGDILTMDGVKWKRG